MLGTVVSLGPGGFWAGWERIAYQASMCLSMRLARTFGFAMPAIAAHDWSRALLLARFSPQARRLSPELVLTEMRSYASAASFKLMLDDFVRGSPLEGAGLGTLAKPVVIGWGLLDRICFPSQAACAQRMFPDARLHLSLIHI